MGLVTGILKTLFRTILVLTIFLGALLVTPGLPPNVKFEAFTLTPPTVFPPNAILDKAKPLELDRVLIGPESIAVRGDELYTGVLHGDIVKIKNGKVTTVVNTGKECEGYWDKRCGRPIGMRFSPQGKLIVADGAKGLLSVDVDKGTIEVLTPVGEEIDGRKVMFPDDVDIDKEGNIYWSDASTNGGIHSAFVEFFAEPSGRLMMYNIKTKKSEVLLNGIHFANGVQLSKNEDFVIVTEYIRARVLRYFLKGPKKGQHEVFVDGLPALPDNIRSNGRGGYYIALNMPRYPYVKPHESLVDILAGQPLVRKLILRLQHLFLLGVNFVEGFVGHDVLLNQISHAISFFGTNPEHLEKVSSNKSIVVEIDHNGKIIGNLQNDQKDIIGVSQVEVTPKNAYFGTPIGKKIWVIETQELYKKQ